MSDDPNFTCRKCGGDDRTCGCSPCIGDVADLRGELHTVYEKLEQSTSRLDVERKAKEDATAMMIEAATRFKALLIELWEGVRTHGLWAPSQGRDGERLIHAYCGGIVKAKERAEEAEKDRNAAIVRAEKAEAERDALRATIDAAKANNAGKLIFDICREFGNGSEEKMDRIMDLTDQLAYAAHANGVRETEPLRAKQAETIQQMYYALISARAAIKIADESPKVFAGGQADVTLRHIHKALALVDDKPKEADMTKLIDTLLEAPDTQLDAAMKPLIKKWQVPQPTPIQILEVLDHCINGSLASDFVVTLLQALYANACKKAGTTHDEVAKLATWRNQ